MLKIIIVGAGGFAGAVLRYLTTLFVTYFFPNPLIPLGTLAVNITGSFLMGAASGYMIFHSVIPENLRYLIITGFLGAFTTYSTFSVESFFLFKENNLSVMTLYILLHLILGIGAVVSGYYLMRAF
ncbi:MAG: fluoride efflux transporter CrcB [Thermodesulfobacteriota bacterium]